MRYAVYFTPAPDDPLYVLGAQWLGRDAFSGATLAQPVCAGVSAERVAEVTASPRRYGFHATLKAPFRLAAGIGEAEAVHAVAAVADKLAPADLGPLQVTRLRDFLALTPVGDGGPEGELAGTLVEQLDQLRAPAGQGGVTRVPRGLSFRQAALLTRWGYPFVFDEFRFHMTLSGPVVGDEGARVRETLEGLFGGVAARRHVIDTITVFVEPAPGAPLRVHSRHRLRGVAATAVAS